MNMLYGYTNFSETNLDYVIKLVRENAGLHLEISGNQLLLKTLDNTVISSVTIHYAEEAGHADTATNAINATYATSANSASTATNATNAGHALTADSATTAGTATTATTATTAGTATEATHATTADTALTANNATHATNADYATTTGSVEHALNAFEGVSANGLKTRFTRGDGTSVDFDVPSAIKADKDTQNNQISTTYIATVEDVNGTLLFKNAIGTTLFSITPSSQTATEDSYGNTIADFIKTITAPSDSNYITVNHGTGLTDTLTVNYANKAWKDTNGNVIKNFYIGSLEIVKDSDTDHYNLVCYNGDTPRAELFRIEVNAYKAQLADEATHATNADYATNAGTASEATHATTADTATTCKNTNIFIKAHSNNDGSWSSSSPDTMTIESIENSAGETLTLSDLETDNLTNVVLIYHQSANDPYLRHYPVSRYGCPGTGNPYFLYFDHCAVYYDSDLSKNTLDSFHADFVYQGGTLLSSTTYTTSDAFA